MRVSPVKLGAHLRCVQTFTDDKHGEIDLFFPDGHSTFVMTGSVGQAKIFFKEALPITGRNGLLFIDTKHFSNVFPVDLKIGYHAKLVEALKRHYHNQSEGYNFFHDSKCKRKPVYAI